MARPLKISEKEDNTIIKQIMREKGISLDELAQRMGRAKPTVSNQLKNANMTISTLESIAKALEVEVADLFPVPSGYIHYQERKKLLNHPQTIVAPIPSASIGAEGETISKDDMALFKKFKEFMSKEKAG